MNEPEPTSTSSDTGASTAPDRTATGATPSPSVPRPQQGMPGPPGSERRKRHIGWRSRDVLRATALVLGLFYLLKLLWFTSPLILTAFLGVLFGLAVAAGVDFLQRWRIPRGLGAALIVFGFVGGLFGIGAWIAPALRQQGREIQRQLPSALDKLEEWGRNRGGLMGSLLAPEPEVTDSAAPRAPDTARPEGSPGAEAPERAQSGQAGEDPSAERAQAAVADSVAAAGPRLRDRVTAALGSATRYLFPFLSTTLTIVGGLLLLIVLSIYIGSDPDTYRRGLMHLFPHRSRAKAGEVLTAIATVLRRWLGTQVIAMMVVGVVTTVVLLVLDVRAALALGVIAGLLEFVPTIGPIISALPALAMGFLDSPQKALYVLIAYVAIQQLENHLLIPMLMKEGVDLPPIVTILGQALMALLFGFLGLLVAVPLIAAIMVPIKMLYVRDVVGDDISVLEDDDDD